jgi:L-fucose isomerase-like protein
MEYGPDQTWRKTMRFAVYVSNRVTFPQEIVRAAVADVTTALTRNGYEFLPDIETVANDAEARTYAAYLKQHQGEYDGVIAVFPNFGDEGSTLTALRDAGTPILFQAYPDTAEQMGPATRRDAFCGKISVMNLFNQSGVDFTALKPHVVHPTSTAFDTNLRDFAAICRVVKGMRRVRIGSIGARPTPFKTVRFDETALERYGITNETFDLSEVFQRYRVLDDDDPIFQQLLPRYRDYAVWPAGTEDALTRIVRLATVIEHMINDYALDMIALRCWTELEQELKISPCVILSELNQRRITANCEVDVINAIAMRALQLAADAPSTCLDWNNNWGDEENRCVLFHCGPVPEAMMQKKGQIGDHPMFARLFGAGCGFGCNEGRMKSGDFTCCSGHTRNGRLAFYLENGRIVDEQLPAEFFGCGGIAEIPGLQNKLLGIGRQGFAHHVSLSYGNHRDVLTEAYHYLGYDIVNL